MDENTNTPSQKKSELTKFIPLAFAALVLIGAIAYTAWNRFGTKEIGSNQQSSVQEETSNPGYTIEQVPIDSLKDIMPDLSRPISFSSNIPQEVRDLFTQKRDQLAAKLKDNPTDGGAWLDLAIQYHGANDFEGARLIWEFLTKALPNDAVAFDNLGKLYQFSTPDFPKAESYFKQSMQVNPKSTLPYIELHDLYKLSYKKETTAAIDILKQGAAAFPDNIDFLVLIGLDYRDRGDTANARVWLNKAMDLARSKNDMNAQSRIGDELSKLPN